MPIPKTDHAVVLPKPGWQMGRQGTGYLKRLLAMGATWDAWLIKYPPGASAPPHRDPVPGKEHHRLNIVLRGDARAMRPVSLHSRHDRRSWLGGRVTLFRPDRVTHEVPAVSRERLVLSIGWVRPADEEGR